MTDGQLPLLDLSLPVHGTADVTEDGRYRYTLTRDWDGRLPRAAWVMLNPSTADALEDDRTIGRCSSFTRAWGLGGFTVVNLYAYRSTDPDGLWTQDDPVGPRNDDALAATLRRTPTIIAAWGVNARPDRVARFWEIARYVRASSRIQALRVTKDGFPGHPLYVPGDTVPVPLQAPPRPTREDQ